MSNYKYQKPQNLATVSTVVYECLRDAWQPTFNLLFPDASDLDIIEKLVADPDTEFSENNLRVLSDEENILGVTASLPLQNVKAIRQKTLFKLIDHAKDKAAFMQKMSVYAGRFPTLPDEPGLYLSKFSIAKAHRGKGLADTLMQNFLIEYDQDAPYFLEVHKDNNAAISLYRKYDFEIISKEQDKEYFVMKRTQ